MIAQISVRSLILLPILGVLAFFALAAITAIALKAPRFFFTVCGLVALLGFLLLVPRYLSPRTIGLGHYSQPPQVTPGEPDDGSAAPSDGLGSGSEGTSPGDLLIGESDAEAKVPADSKQTVTASAAPAWVGTTGGREGDNVIHVIEGELYATPHEASRQALAKAAELAREYLAQSQGDKVLTWNVPIAYVHDAMIEDQHAESVQRDYGTMYRTHLLMKLTSEHRFDLKRMWRDQVVTKRIWSAGGVLSLVVLLLATAAGYLKLDDATRGYYSGRLKLAALAVATGGATAVVAVLRAAVG